jgi:DNA-binding CsgD family transcriptional regulator
MLMSATMPGVLAGDHPSHLGSFPRRVPSNADVAHPECMGTTHRRGLAMQLHDAAEVRVDLPTLARHVYAGVAQNVAFDFACFATTDPATGMITWASKTRSLGVGDEEFAAAEYGPDDINSFAEIARRRPPVGALCIDTGGRPDTCRRHRDFMHPRFGFTDELRVVFLSRGVSWGGLALYRGEGQPPFTSTEAGQLGTVSALLAEAIQRSLFRLGPASRAGQPPPTAAITDGPAVLIIDSSDHVTHLTAAARSAIADLGGWEHGSLPTTVLAVVASTRTRTGCEHRDTRTQGRSGRWLSVRAALLTGQQDASDVVVTIEPTPRTALTRLTLAAQGLSTREEEVAVLVLQGASTHAIATALHLSPYTVQDHLKAIFSKLGVSSRREMTARMVLE